MLPGAVYLLAGIFARPLPSPPLATRAANSRRALSGGMSSTTCACRIPHRRTGGPDYGLLQKCAYSAVVFVAPPLCVLTGLTMSPAVTAAFPFLSTLFGGYQSARTIHFFAFVALDALRVRRTS